MLRLRIKEQSGVVGADNDETDLPNHVRPDCRGDYQLNLSGDIEAVALLIE